MSVASSAERVEAERLVAIVRVATADAARAALGALVEGGVRVAEVSLASGGALDAIAAAARDLGDELLVGAGTVRSVEDAERSLEAGATYLVSPTLDDAVAAWAQAHDVLLLPGAFSPAEVLAASRISPLVKLFPAGRLGPAYVRDLLAPFPELKLVPTGAVDEGNARAFLDAGAVAVAVGGSLVNDASAADPAALARAAARLRTTLTATTKEDD